MDETRRRQFPQRSLEAASDAAASALGARSLEEIVARAGAKSADGGIALDFFGQRVRLSLPDLSVSPELREMERILLLHYLGSSAEIPAGEDWVSFQQLPGGAFYEPAFRKRGPARIVAAFGARPELLLQAGRAAGAEPASFGDVSLLFRVLPRVETAVVLHRADEELGAEAGMLFRRNIVGFFSLEDVAVLAGLVASRLERALRAVVPPRAAP